MKKTRTAAIGSYSLVEGSFLRALDPRVKLAMSFCASLIALLPLEKLIIASIGYFIFIAWAHLLPIASRHIWRIRWLLIVLFIFDWLFFGPALALAVTVRLVLLVGTFALLVSTTTPSEFQNALAGLRIPYRYAFSLGIAFESLAYLEGAWDGIREAQFARGIKPLQDTSKRLIDRIRGLVALTGPAFVLATKRAWAVTEAAHSRGFDSPNRRTYKPLKLKPIDWFLLIGTGTLAMLLLIWR
jgi:energy-coupling factor transporter transmembrane protein EcfT